MSGKFKCYIHNFSTYSMAEWEIHLSEKIHLTTGYIVIKGKKQQIMHFGRIPKGLTVRDVLK